MINTVRLNRSAQKDLRKLPRHIVVNFQIWVRTVKLEGIERARLVKGYHDEPLRGTRKGQRSIRLSKAYRAVYTIEREEIEIVLVQEVNKHDY